jgi:hypothetical protein
MNQYTSKERSRGRARKLVAAGVGISLAVAGYFALLDLLTYSPHEDYVPPANSSPW